MARLPHRALILQGGGALGAYEAGAYKALYEEITKEDKKNGNKDKPPFDIVAGSSIGAVNACFLVSYVLNNERANPGKSITKCWEGSDDALLDFWMKLANKTLLDYPTNQIVWNWTWDSAKITREGWNRYWKNLIDAYPDIVALRQEWPFIQWYFLWPDKWGPLAAGEGARRYSSYLSSMFQGVNGVLTAGIAQPDFKFFNALPFLRFDNDPLVKMMNQNWYQNGEPIATKKGEPRLLLVSVDVQDCSSAVTFDSYEKKLEGSKDRDHFSQYGAEEDPKIIKYEGISIEQMIASMSISQRYEFPSMSTADGKETRYFWDGAYLSNTPLREVIQHHRDYWLKTEGEKEVPDLEVYIVNLYPATEETVPQDADSIQDREIDIKFHDRTKYDLKVAEMVTDYIDLATKLRKLAESNGLSDQVKNILDSDVKKSNGRGGNKRKYRALLDGRFAISRVVHVERKDDENSIYGKSFDFSRNTIEALIKSGYDEAAKAFDDARKDNGA